MNPHTPLWLTRPEDIHGHLLYAASEIPSVVLTVEGLQIHGRLTQPDLDSGSVAFSIDPVLEGLVHAPTPGRSVRVEYVGHEDAYRFFSEVTGTDVLRRWVLDVPRTVERTHRRLVARHAVHGKVGFELMVHIDSEMVVCSLVDVSNTGLAFEYWHGALDFTVGDVIEATLQLPGATAISLGLEIRNGRPGRSPGKRIAGARLVGMKSGDQPAIARALSSWALRHKQPFR